MNLNLLKSKDPNNKIKRRVTKLIKKVKDYSYRVRWENTLLERRMKGDLIETFKIINGISYNGRCLFYISLRMGNLLSRQISKMIFSNELGFFCK